jgi:DNA-directed RNA polymerase specialized sigma24 family protein
MLRGEPVGDFLSPAEIGAALEVLPEAGWIRLRKVANALSRHRLVDADDLLQTAFTRALEGSRRCPREVDVIRFLAEAMRSIASDGLKALSRRRELRLVPATSEGDLPPFDPPDSQPTVEERLAAEQEANRIRAAVLALFDDDLIAQTIIEGDMEQMEAEELRHLTGLDKIAYASKRRLIRRRPENAFPKGWKP